MQKSVVLPESQKPVQVPFKVLRGMASIEAIRDRLDVEDADVVDMEALGAEGIEVSVPLRGSVAAVIQEMLRHLCSSISYGGADSLAGLRARVSMLTLWVRHQAVAGSPPRVIRTGRLKAKG